MVNLIKRKQPDHCIFVIDTDTYAGNFEREMCAYVTGQIGDCGVGYKQAQLAKQEIPSVVAQLGDLIKSVPDEHGCHRPVSIFPNTRYGNDGNGNHALLTDENRNKFPWPAYNSVAIYFHSIPDFRLLDVIKERARNFSNVMRERPNDFVAPANIQIEGFRFLEQYTTYKKLITRQETHRF